MNSIHVKTINNQEYTFGLLLSVTEAYSIIEQLSKMAMQKMIQDPDSPQYHEQHTSTVHSAQKLTKNPSKKSYLMRDLTKRQQSDKYRIFFRLPQSEILDGNIKGARY